LKVSKTQHQLFMAFINLLGFVLLVIITFHTHTMALTDKVIFGIDDNRIEAKYNKEHLRLGATVYVTKDNCIENFVFSIHQQEKSIPYYVTWISPPTWYVVLKSQYSLDERLVSNTIEAVSKYMNTSDVRLALEFAAKEICPERMFMTKEYERSRLAAISSVIKRLDLCDRLWSFQVRKEIFYHHLLISAINRLHIGGDMIYYRHENPRCTFASNSCTRRPSLQGGQSGS